MLYIVLFTLPKINPMNFILSFHPPCHFPFLRFNSIFIYSSVSMSYLNPVTLPYVNIHHSLCCSIPSVSYLYQKTTSTKPNKRTEALTVAFEPTSLEATHKLKLHGPKNFLSSKKSFKFLHSSISLPSKVCIIIIYFFSLLSFAGSDRKHEI